MNKKIFGIACWEDNEGNKITLQDILDMIKNIPQKDYPTKELVNIVLNWDNNPHEIERIEQITKHDVIAFLTNVAKYVGDESRFIHKGLTSSDILTSDFFYLRNNDLIYVQVLMNSFILYRRSLVAR